MKKYQHQILLATAALIFMTAGAGLLYFILQKMTAQAFQDGYTQAVTDERIKAVEAAHKERLARVRYVKNNIDQYLCVTEKRFISNVIFGSIFDVNITLTNKSEFDFDNVTLQVDYLKGDGSLYDSEILNFKKVVAGQSYPTQAPGKWRGKSIRVFVTDYQLRTQS